MANLIRRCNLLSTFPGIKNHTLGKKGAALTLDSGIDVGQGINLGPGKFVKKNKHMVLNKPRPLTAKNLILG